MKIAILGAGISGLSLFDIMDRFYGIRADLYEMEQQIGGLCRTRQTDGFTFDMSGGHVYNSRFERVNNYVFSLVDKEKWTCSKRRSKIDFEGEIIDYPFEFALHMLKPEIAAECIIDLFNVNENVKASNFKEFLINKFGKKIFELYLKPYNEKIWKMSLNNISSDWVEGKMPNPNKKEIILNALSRNSDETKMVHSNYYYPKEGGIQSLIDHIGANIPVDHLGEKIETIEFEDNHAYVNGNKYDFIIWTMPLKVLNTAIKSIPVSAANSIGDLKYNNLLTLLFSCEKENDYSWTYIPDKSFIPHRIVYQGNLSNKCCPDGRSSMTFEVTRPQLYDLKEIINQIKARYNVEELIDYHFTEYAYSIYDLNRKENMRIINSYFKGKPIVFHGRFANWEYPNMDVCINNSFDIAEQISDSI